MTMTQNKGEQVLEALLDLGYTVDISDAGKITATNGEQTLHGKAEHAGIEWENGYPTYQVLEQAYILKLRSRIRQHRYEHEQPSAT